MGAVTKTCADCDKAFKVQASCYGPQGEIRAGAAFTDACEFCCSLRAMAGRCVDCGCDLTDANRWNHDAEAKWCQICWDRWEQLPQAVVLCAFCCSELEQDHEDFSQLWCPKCLEVRADVRRMD